MVALNNQIQNLIKFPGNFNLPKQTLTPLSDKIEANIKNLNLLSKYHTSFNCEIFNNLEISFKHSKALMRFPEALIKKDDLLEMIYTDTYQNGCSNNCIYCPRDEENFNSASKEIMPTNIFNLWKIFFEVFETNKPHKWRRILESRTPINIGNNSDPFMHVEEKYRLTEELIKILNFYKYPYIISTKSDLVAYDQVLNILDPGLALIKMQLSSTDIKMNMIMEPGATSAKGRLEAIKKLSDSGYNVSVSIDPFFPIYPDGYFSDPNFEKKNVQVFPYSSFEMIDEISTAKPTFLESKIAEPSHNTIKKIMKLTDIDLSRFYKHSNKNNLKNLSYSFEEKRVYYEKIQSKCIQNSLFFNS